MIPCAYSCSAKAKLLLAEEAIQRTADIAWWTPRKQQLEALRRQALK